MIEMNVIDVIERREVDRDDCDVREDGGEEGEEDADCQQKNKNHTP